MRARLLTRDDPAWPAALSRVHHDFYHLPAFAELAARWHAPGTAAAFLAEEEDRTFLLPLIIRPIPDELLGGVAWLDATGPRGYPGPVVGPSTADVDQTFVDRAIVALIETLRAHQIVTAFIRCHPLLSPGLEILSRGAASRSTASRCRSTLPAPRSEVWRQIRDDHRHSISRARRAGYGVRVDEGWRRLEEFVAVYAATMERVGAARHWRLSIEYFTDLRTAVAPGVHLCVVEPMAARSAAILTEVDGVVEYPPLGDSARPRPREPHEAAHRGGEPLGSRTRQSRLPPRR